MRIYLHVVFKSGAEKVFSYIDECDEASVKFVLQAQYRSLLASAVKEESAFIFNNVVINAREILYGVIS